MTLTEALYLVVILCFLIFLITISINTIFLIFSWLKGAPYVPTERKEIAEILKRGHLKKNMHFIELGCGDGRVVEMAVREYEVKGRGIDINPLLIMRARVFQLFHAVDNLKYEKMNVLNADLSEADVIYLFLFPALIAKLEQTITKQTKRPLLIISHGFKVPYLHTHLQTIRKGKNFKTYYYLLKK
jgi:SAM-dependent methyltransferase